MLYQSLVLDEKLETKHWVGLMQSTKDKFMYMELSQMEARILRVKFHQKLTSTQWLCYFEQRGLKAKERLRLIQLFNIKSPVLF